MLAQLGAGCMSKLAAASILLIRILEHSSIRVDLLHVRNCHREDFRMFLSRVVPVSRLH
jgi:hypothetical protein